MHNHEPRRNARNKERRDGSGNWIIHGQTAEESDGGDGEEEAGEGEGAGHGFIVNHCAPEMRNTKNTKCTKPSVAEEAVDFVLLVESFVLRYGGAESITFETEACNSRK